jgi:hypothetical protein
MPWRTPPCCSLLPNCHSRRVIPDGRGDSSVGDGAGRSTCTMVDLRWPLTAATVTRTPTSDRPHDPVFSLSGSVTSAPPPPRSSLVLRSPQRPQQRMVRERSRAHGPLLRPASCPGVVPLDERHWISAGLTSARIRMGRPPRPTITGVSSPTAISRRRRLHRCRAKRRFGLAEDGRRGRP